MDITGRKLFVKALEEEGVDTIFAYPGGTVTDLFDELYKTNSINLVLPRHEQGLIHEAEGYAKSTGRVGVCLVTSGPVGQKVIYSKYAGTEVKLDGEEYIIVRQNDILAVVE